MGNEARRNDGAFMKVLETGHIYQPQNRQEDTECQGQTIRFINKEPGSEHGGTTTQEIIRILIDRTRHCANCMPHPNNERIVYHLRLALVLHEARALERKTEKGDIEPEYLDTGKDGHFFPTAYDAGELDTTHLVPHRHDWDRGCNHPRKEPVGPMLVKANG
jgi:hypothetical protein